MRVGALIRRLWVMKFGLAILMLVTPMARAATVFEGFYRVERDRKHVGFAVQRLRREGDQRVLTSYFRFKRNDAAEVFESYKTVLRKNGEPVASEHQGNATGLPPVWAKFTARRGRVDFVTPQSRAPASLKDVKLLSSTLFLVADLPKLVPKRVYKYHAYSDDHGDVNVGTLRVVDVIKVGRTSVLHLVDDYNGEVNEHFVSPDGQPLGSRSYRGDLSCYWVSTRESAIQEFGYPNRDVISRFGDLPAGTENTWATLTEFNADEFMRRIPKWRGPRVRSVSQLAKTPVLPVRTL